MSDEPQPAVKPTCPACGGSMESEFSSYYEFNRYSCAGCGFINYIPEDYPVELTNIVFRYLHEHEELTRRREIDE